jgi:hypothetical protein
MYEIFEFFDFHHAFEVFHGLNTRFQNLFVNSNLPIKINISSVSKSAFQRSLRHIIIPHADRIQSFRLSNPFAADMSLLLLPVMPDLIRLETLIINNIESAYIRQVLKHLSSLPVLFSLIIKSVDNSKNQNQIYQTIFRLPTLKYCQIFIETLRHRIPLPIATNKFSSIEHLVINNEISIDQLDCLLSYVPKLRRLSLAHLNRSIGRRTRISSITLNCLTNVFLKLYSVSFDDFEQLARDFFHQVHVLRIEISCNQYYNADMDYLNADQWERLISTHIPNLRIFDFQHEYRCRYNNNGQQAYETQVNKFNSSFWMKHQWFFEHQYYDSKYCVGTVFYSTNPHK